MAEAYALRPAVFLDRDGAICEEGGHLNHVSRFRMFPLIPAKNFIAKDLAQAVEWVLRHQR